MITDAEGKVFTVTVTGFDFVQPVAVIVSVRVYEVVEAGVTDGFDEVEEKPDGELVQEYVWPAVDAAPIEIELPRQIAVLAITEAEGKVFTVTVTGFEFVQPVAVMVSVRV